VRRGHAALAAIGALAMTIGPDIAPLPVAPPVGFVPTGKKRLSIEVPVQGHARSRAWGSTKAAYTPSAERKRKNKIAKASKRRNRR
jgi:hypothetical protein